ncbi:MAG TPA: flagellar biosynthesis anti-sigma factor FlgM [Desulfotignum sp.]|nr:flagellar biosynthesis anti-sigma factor FlgM [Desulfotignum sp.]
MKISNHNNIIAQYASKAMPAAVPAKTGRQADELQSDTIKLSDTTRDLQKISQAIEAEPADRKKQVSDLKDQVQAGLYNVNAQTVAEKMMLGLDKLV